MRPRRVPTPLALIGARSTILHEPKGISLIVSPWNYPVNLTIGPLVHALAAGCTAVLKPSEHTPTTSRVMKEMLATIFPETHVAVVEGDATTAQTLLELPFNHIFFTGSTRNGQHVMEAASRNLASVTLELGGKCPAIVDASADIRKAALRIVQTKFVNSGQSCVAPDYVMVHRAVHHQLLDELKTQIEAFFQTPEVMNDSYANLIHDAHMKKMTRLLEDARDRGAHILTGGMVVPGTRKFPPTILDRVPLEAGIMQEEIFGPLLPVISYGSTEEAIRTCNALDRPLGVYVFGRGKVVRELIRGTRAGNACINHCAINYYNPNMPFGGINQSGIGKSHGYDGFLAFSNQRSVLIQRWSTPLDWLHPPYNKAKQFLIDVLLRWL
jgi:aldehyde dehydrogenase (NAD+)